MKKIGFIKKVLLTGALALLAGTYGFYNLNKNKEANTQNIECIKGVESIIEQEGNKPDVIIILQNHIDQNVSNKSTYSKVNNINSIKSICDICNTLYDQFGIKTLLPEGLDPSFEKSYKKNGKLSFQQYDSAGYTKHLEDMINGRNWNLKFAEDPNKINEIERLKKPLKKQYQLVLKETTESLDSIDKKYENDPYSLKKELEINSLIKRSNENIKDFVDSYMSDETTQKFYDLMIEQRDKMYAEACKSAKNDGETPLIIVYGSAHCYTLPKHLNGLSYIIIKPEGLSKIKPIDLQGIKERFYMRLSR